MSSRVQTGCSPGLQSTRRQTSSPTASAWSNTGSMEDRKGLLGYCTTQSAVWGRTIECLSSRCPFGGLGASMRAARYVRVEFWWLAADSPARTTLQRDGAGPGDSSRDSSQRGEGSQVCRYCLSYAKMRSERKPVDSQRNLSFCRILLRTSGMSESTTPTWSRGRHDWGFKCRNVLAPLRRFPTTFWWGSAKHFEASAS